MKKLASLLLALALVLSLSIPAFAADYVPFLIQNENWVTGENNAPRADIVTYLYRYNVM